MEQIKRYRQAISGGVTPFDEEAGARNEPNSYGHMNLLIFLRG
jgi:hypothetical protein